MPLQRLELYNFKSYRGSQVIDFGDAPFMCIIGPNGGGKSNLMDAISFVLGVKSAQLRSTQLKDLIYRGRKAAQGEDDEAMDVDEPEMQSQSTDARTAHVMAVYEDDKGKEWKFKRSISTSGQSTYFLNNKAVQWTAYNNQLEQFNILVKAKNFLVFQGDVEGVASQDSKALAKLIDRISGSLDLAPRYEAAKEAQDKATEASTANYNKKRTMIAEVKQYKEQKEEMKQWERLRQNRDTMIQRHLLWRLYHITSAINESTRQVEEANEKLEELRTEVNEDDKKLQSARKDQAQAQLNVKQREIAVKKAEKALEDKKPELVAIETQIEHSRKRAQNARTLRQRVEKDEERQEESLATLEKGAAEIAARMKEAADKQRKKSQAAGKALSQADLDEYRNLRSQANTVNVSERQQLETLRRERKTLRDALASIEDKMQQAEIQKTKLEGEVDRLAEREGTMSAKVAEMTSERERIKMQLDLAQQERQRINQKETEINERLQKTYNQLLQAGVDRRESEREKKLKETLAGLKRVFPGVHGRLIDLCSTTADKYRTAVATVIGRHIDAVVVEHEKVAIDCIEYMRTQRAGQATFIPLDTIQVKPVPERLRNFTKGARLAIDCISYDPKIERAIQHACGSSMICDTMAIAKYVCYDKAQEVKAVTLEGTVIHKSGLITGGQSSGGRQFDDREVEGLKQAKETYLQQLHDLSKSKRKDKADEGLLENIARLDAEIGVAKDDLDATRLRLRGLRDELKHIEADLKKMAPDLEKRSKGVKEADDKLEKLQTTVDAADDGVFQAFCRKIRVASIRDYEDVQLKMAQEESEAMEAFSAQQSRVQHQIEFEKTQLKSTQERLASLQATIDREERNVEARQSAKVALEEELQSLQEAIDMQKAKLEKYTAILDKANHAVEELREAARKTQRRLDKKLKDITVWNDEIEKSASDRHAIYRRCRLEEIDLPLVAGSLDKVPLEEANNMMDVDSQPPQVDDFGIEPDFDQLEEEDKEDGSEDVGREFESQIAKMKTDLEKVMPNMKAIERLTGAQTELEEAEEEADQTRRESKRAKDEFQDLKKKRHDLFTKAHNHISGCIDQVYKDLTKSSIHPDGGFAFLSLEDADEPYLSGVRYNVMPPGKPFAEMEQLSGGEKTMAALALLFAIHSFHPAPFFVLDEVDAALDSTNVAKLARYIRAQAQNDVQFLIISLKSALYEHADGLVGVYREQEENSSRTLTLDLRKYVN